MGNKSGCEVLEDWTVDEFAAYTNRNVDVIRRLCREGKLPCYQIGGQWRVHRQKFEALRQGQAVTHDV